MGEKQPKLNFHIDAGKCISCKDCVDVCPVDCIIPDTKNKAYKIVSDKCIDCGACLDVCPVDKCITTD